MRVMQPVSHFNRRLIAAWLLAFAAVSPAAAGPVEPVRQTAAPIAVRVAERPVVQTDVSAKTSTTTLRRAAEKRDPRLNDDLAAFSRAF